MKTSILTPSESKRVKTATSAFASRRSSKPSRTVTDMAEVLLLGQDSKRVFIQDQKSDLFGMMSRPNYTVINGVPHKIKNGRYVSMTAVA